MNAAENSKGVRNIYNQKRFYQDVLSISSSSRSTMLFIR